MTDRFSSRHKAVDLIVRKADRTLVVGFDGGERFELPAELLRVESPSAEVQGHNPSEKTLVAGRANVAIIGVEPVGNYAVRLVFDDGHDTGIFTWDYLYMVGSRRQELWDAYVTALEDAGFSRHHGGPAPRRGGGCG